MLGMGFTLNRLRKPLRMILRFLLIALVLCIGISLRHEVQAQVDDNTTKDIGNIFSQRGIDILIQRDLQLKPNNHGLPEQLAERISKVKGVKQVDYGLMDVVQFEPQNVDPELLFGLPPNSPFYEFLKIQSGGRKLASNDGRQAIIGRDLARTLNKTVGDEIELYQSEKFQIVGVYFSKNPFENNGVIVPLKELQLLMHRPGEISGITITATRPIDDRGLGELRDRLEALQPGLQAGLPRKMEKEQRNKPDALINNGSNVKPAESDPADATHQP